MKFINSIAKTFWRFLTKKMRLENGAKECIVQISARAFQRVFTCKNRRRYSRERAHLILINFSSLQLFNFDRALASRRARAIPPRTCLPGGTSMLVDGVCRVSSAFFFCIFLIHAFVITWVANHGFVLRILVLFSRVYWWGLCTPSIRISIGASFSTSFYLSNDTPWHCDLACRLICVSTRSGRASFLFRKFRSRRAARTSKRAQARPLRSVVAEWRTTLELAFFNPRDFSR